MVTYTEKMKIDSETSNSMATFCTRKSGPDYQCLVSLCPDNLYEIPLDYGIVICSHEGSLKLHGKSGRSYEYEDILDCRSNNEFRHGEKVANGVVKLKKISKTRKFFRCDGSITLLTEDPWNTELPVYYSSQLELGRFIGSGIHGTVHLLSGSRRNVAVRKFSSDVARYKHGGIEKLIRKRADIVHPNLVPILGICFASPEYKTYPLGYVMEFMPGGSLSDVIHGRTEPPDSEYDYRNVLDWTRQAAAGLHFLHENKMTHRNIKPANMLLSSNRGVLKIGDLKLFHPVCPMTRANVVYAAPEQMDAPATTLHYEKCDVYSLAVSVWEMYHRQQPFSDVGSNLLLVSHKIIDGERPLIWSECDSELRDIIERSWSGDVENRPSMQHIHEFTIARLKRIQLTLSKL